MDNFQIKQTDTGQHVKIVDGEARGEATPGEVFCYSLRKNFAGVEAGILEVALALAGVTGFLCTLSQVPAVKIVAAIAFLVSVIAAYNLTWLYVLPRIPITWTHYVTSAVKRRYPRFPFPVWLPFYLIRETVRLSFSLLEDSAEQALELCYLMLFAATAGAGLALTGYVLGAVYAAIF
jgi:hypothetical protein